MFTRALGPAENFFRCRTEVDFYRNFFAVGKFSRRIEPDLLCAALRSVILENPILICNVFKNENECVFRPIEHAEFADLAEYRDAPIDETVMHDLCRTPWFSLYTETPLFKVLVHGQHVAVAFEHTMADGVVGPLFLHLLLEKVAKCKPTSSDVVFDLKEDGNKLVGSLPPPVELIMAKGDHTGGDPNHYSLQVPESHPIKWPGRFPSAKANHAAFKLIRFSKAELDQMLKRCKQEQVTLTSFILVNLAFAFQPIIGDAHHSLTLVAVTLRRFIKQPSILGNFAHMGLPERLPPVTNFDWELVRKVNGHLAQTVQNDLLLNTSMDFNNKAHPTDKNEALFTDSLGKPKADTTKISNLGFQDFKVYGDWTIEDVFFAQDLAPSASEFVLSVISSRGGLNIVLSYFDDRFRDSEEELFDELPERLRRALVSHSRE